MAKLVIKTEGLPVEVIELKKGLNRLGRSVWNDFQFNHGSISRFHAEIEVHDDIMFVRDLDSSNGTFVNDEAVEQSPLESGQILRLGDIRMEVKDAPKPAAERETPMCHLHPVLPASMVCTQCSKQFCGACVHILKRAGGRVLRLCPACSGHCEPLTPTAPEAKPTLSRIIQKLLKRPPPDQPFHR